MRVMVLLLAFAGVITAFAADNAVGAPQSTASPQSSVAGLRSPVVVGADAITIPRMLSYQGKLTDTLGQPVPNNDYSVAFKLYTVPSGGSPLWSETQSVTTKSGLFSVLLGSVAPIGSVPDAGTVYIGMAVSGGAELTPRPRIVSAAYAYKADTANYASAAAPTGAAGGGLTGTYPDPWIAANSVGSLSIVDGSIATNDIHDTTITGNNLNRMGATTNQVLKWTGSAWAPRNDSIGGGGGGGTVTSVSQATGVVCTPNPITTTGTVRFDSTWGNSRYVNEAQTAGGDLTGTYPNPTIAANAVGSAEVSDASLRGVDVAVPCTLSYSSTGTALRVDVPSAGRGIHVYRQSTGITNPAIHGQTTTGSGAGVIGEATGDDGTSVGIYGHTSPGTRPGVFGYNAPGTALAPNVAAGVAAYSQSGPGVCVSGAATAGVHVACAPVQGILVDSAGWGVDIPHAATGIRINRTNYQGVLVGKVTGGSTVFAADSGGYNGFGIDHASHDGYAVSKAARHGFALYDSAQFDGVYIREADTNGLEVDKVGYNGLQVDTAGSNGVYVGRASDDAFEAGSVNYGLYAPSATYYGAWANGGSVGGNFGATAATGVGVLARSYNNSSSDTAILAYGRGYATGGWYTGGLEGDGEAPCVVSPERGIMAAGRARLVDGTASVRLDPVVAENIPGDVPVHVTVTPCGRPGGQLYVPQSDRYGFAVGLEAIPGMLSDRNCEFDWIAFAVLREPAVSAAARANWEQEQTEMKRKAHPASRSVEHDTRLESAIGQTR